MALDALDRQSPEKLLDGVRILELANKAYFLYLRQPPAEKAKLLRIVLSNCKIDAARLDPRSAAFHNAVSEFGSVASLWSI